MDRLVILSVKGAVEDIPTSPGFAKLKVDTSVQNLWKDFISDSGYLEPRKVCSRFKKLFEDAAKIVNEENPGGYSGIKQPVNDIEVGGGYSVAVTIDGNFGPNNWAFGTVKCDLVLLIDFTGLPPTMLAPWIQENPSPSHWPTVNTVYDIRNKIGYGLVAKRVEKYDCVDMADLPLMWRYSVSRAETRILRDCDEQLTYKKLLVIMKAIRLYEIPESTVEPVLTSYHIKTVIFHEAYTYPHADDWCKEKIGERFLSALRRLQSCIKDKHLSHFFFPVVNLFTGNERQKLGWIETILADPSAYLSTLAKTKFPFQSPFAGKE